MKDALKVIKGFVLGLIRSINFTSIIMGALAGFGGIFGRIIAVLGKPIIQSVEDKIDKDISSYEDTEKSDDTIDKAAQTHVDETQKAKTDEEIDEAFRDSLR